MGSRGRCPGGGDASLVLAERMEIGRRVFEAEGEALAKAWMFESTTRVRSSEFVGVGW